MNPGKQRWGLGCRDGSDLKNTEVPFIPACALLPLTLAILHLLYFTSRLLLSLAPTFFTILFMFSHHITTSLSPFLFSIDGNSILHSKDTIQSPFLSLMKTAKILFLAVTFIRILTFRRNEGLRVILFFFHFQLYRVLNVLGTSGRPVLVYNLF